MEFWGTEVAAGKPELCSPGDDTYCHVSQAALGPSANGKSERVTLRVETGGKDIVLGTLSSGKCDQMSLDLIFDRDFKLSHTGTSCSVFFCGYKTEKGEMEEYSSEEDEEEGESEDEPVPVAVPIKENGDAKKAVKVIKPGKESPADPAPVKAKPSKKSPVKASLIDDEADEDDDESESDDEDELSMNPVVMDFDSDDFDEEDDSEFEGEDMDDSDEEDDSDEMDEDEESGSEEESEEEAALTPELLGKRKSVKVDAKSPAPTKKSRIDTPAKPGLIASPGKKSGKGAPAAKATPVPASAAKKPEKEMKTPLKTPGKAKTESKEDGKTPKTASKTASKTPTTPVSSAKKLGGSHKCTECDRNFATETAATQHMTAKHGK